MAAEAPPPPDARLHDAASADMAADGAQKLPVKRSWRRKFRKMRVQFDNAMTESNRLILDEWKAMGTARRLQQENDQLLDALLDFNDQPRVPARHRFDLRDIAHADTPMPSLEAAPDALHQRLHDLRRDLHAGALSPAEHAYREHQLHAEHALLHTIKSLASLEARVPHTTRADLPDYPIDGIDLSEHAPGYMSPAHEDEFLLAADQTYDVPDFDFALHQGHVPRVPPTHPPLSEKELTVRNPDSVYSWLRKHQPQVFLQDKDAAHHENMSEKSAPKTGNASHKKIKREPAVPGGTPGPRDHDDEDSGLAPETTKGRRKTGGGGGGGGGSGGGANNNGGGDDDTAYRPKGGSSRPSKRKREDGDAASKTAKKKMRASQGPAA